ncbi:hypothetical protein V8C86DRAFT_3204576 [Haematococcus lacustris]
MQLVAAATGAATLPITDDHDPVDLRVEAPNAGDELVTAAVAGVTRSLSHVLKPPWPHTAHTSPSMLPVLYLVTLATIPLTIMYAIMGLLFSPIIVPVSIIIKHLSIVLFFPLYLVVAPLAIPVGGILAFLFEAKKIACSFFTVLTPLLWPLCFLCTWMRASWTVTKVLVTDTIMPWLVPLRWTFITALLGKMTFFS